MFSGIHSLLFGKKHKHKPEETQDDSALSHTTDNDFVVLERRHSDEYDKNSGIYPDLDPSNPHQSNLPYGVSPSLPNLKEATSNSSNEEVKVHMLDGVPFVLSSQILLLDNNEDKTLKRIIKSLTEIKDSGAEGFLEEFSYDFELEHSVSSSYST